MSTKFPLFTLEESKRLWVKSWHRLIGVQMDHNHELTSGASSTTLPSLTSDVFITRHILISKHKDFLLIHIFISIFCMIFIYFHFFRIHLFIFIYAKTNCQKYLKQYIESLEEYQSTCNLSSKQKYQFLDQYKIKVQRHWLIKSEDKCIFLWIGMSILWIFRITHLLTLAPTNYIGLYRKSR